MYNLNDLFLFIIRVEVGQRCDPVSESVRLWLRNQKKNFDMQPDKPGEVHLPFPDR